MILVLNLKMNLSKQSIMEYERFIRDKNVIVLPQYPYLLFFSKGNYKLGSQDVSKFAKGSYTGEVCAKGLRTLGVKYSLIGHSERKIYFNETTVDFKNKMENVANNGIIPIYCIDQTFGDKENDLELKKIEEQLEAIPSSIKYIMIAYEPVWLIGNDLDLSKEIEHINKVQLKIKDYLMERGINHSIIYGGGVNNSNIDDLKKLSINEGFIVSSSALDVNSLEELYKKID